MIINSTSQQTDQTTLFKGAYKLDRKGEVKEISEPLIIDDTVATLRVKAEFLEYGYDKQEVDFTTYFTPLKINSIIKIYAPNYRIPKNLEKDRFIVKKVTHTFKDGIIKTKLKAIRYDWRIYKTDKKNYQTRNKNKPNQKDNTSKN